LWAAFFAAEVPAPTIDVTPDDDFLTHPSLITSLLFNKRVLLPASIGWGMVRAAPGRAVAKVLERVTKWRRRRRFEQIKRAKKKQHEEKEKHLEGLWRAEQTWLEAKQYLYTYELPPALCLNPAVCQAVVGTVHSQCRQTKQKGSKFCIQCTRNIAEFESAKETITREVWTFVSTLSVERNGRMYQIPRTQPLPKRLTIGVLKGVVDFLYQQGVVGVPGPNDKQRKTLLNRLGDLNL
jgi:hypothetical protein